MLDYAYGKVLVMPVGSELDILLLALYLRCTEVAQWCSSFISPQ